MCCGYNPNKALINKFTHDIGKELDSFIGNYENFLIVRDLSLKLLKTQCIIYTDYVIHLPVIKIRKNHHALIFFEQILLSHSKALKQWR